jgi:PAS domain S-box-containing protein
MGKGNVVESFFASKELYNVLFDNRDESTIIASNFEIIDCNIATLSSFGFTTKSDLIGRSLFDLCLKIQDDGISSREKFQKLIVSAKPGSTNKIGWKYIKPDKTLIDAELTINLFSYENCVFQQFTIRQNTSLRNKEKAIIENEFKYKKMFENVRDVFYRTDLNGILTEISPSIKRYSKYVHSDIIGQPIENFYVNPEDRKLLIKEISEKGEALDFEILLKGTDNQQVWSSVNAHFTYDETDKVSGVEGTIRDLTERKKAEELLRQSETKYRNLIETMPDGVYRSTPEGKFIEVNDAMVRILGYDSKEDLMSIDIKTQLYFDPEERERLTKKLRINELDIFPLRKKDGSTVYIEDHGWLVTDDSGKTIFHEGISRDVTQRKNAEVQLQEYSEQLKELVATKDKFFSIIAHDLKSPFNSIIGLSEIIKNDAKHLDIAAIEQYAGIIHSTSNNTFRLLENLLDWARIQQSQMPFHPVSLVLKTLTNEVLEFLIEKANSKMIAIINYIPDHLIVMADKNMIRTILRNLISNALKFTSKNGKIEIKAVERENKVEISIEDTGIGIKPEDIDKIFKIGSNFSKRGTENEKGTGLGLLLCKEFVEEHGGEIWVESEEGKGSSFKFSIPITL